MRMDRWLQLTHDAFCEVCAGGLLLLSHTPLERFEQRLRPSSVTDSYVIANRLTLTLYGALEGRRVAEIMRAIDAFRLGRVDAFLHDLAALPFALHDSPEIQFDRDAAVSYAGEISAAVVASPGYFRTGIEPRPNDEQIILFAEHCDAVAQLIEDVLATVPAERNPYYAAEELDALCLES
jgi:hypothetical protein